MDSSSKLKAEQAFLPFRQLMEADAARKQLCRGKAEDSCSSTCDASTIGSELSLVGSLAASSAPSVKSTARASKGSPQTCSSAANVRKLLPVLSLAEAEEAIASIFGSKVEDTRDSLSTSCATSCAESFTESSAGSYTSAGSLARRRAEPEAAGAPSDRLESSARRRIVSDFFVAQAPAVPSLGGRGPFESPETSPEAGEQTHSRPRCAAQPRSRSKSNHRALNSARRAVSTAKSAEVAEHMLAVSAAQEARDAAEEERRRGALQRRLRELESLNPGGPAGWKHMSRGSSFLAQSELTLVNRRLSWLWS